MNSGTFISEDPNLHILLNKILSVGHLIKNKLASIGITDSLGNDTDQINTHGDPIKMLDHVSNELFKSNLLDTGLIYQYISEEDKEATYSNGNYIVAIDPCDGSSNIDCNVPVGTIFGIWRKWSNLIGREIICSGYLLYGPSFVFVCTTNNGVNAFTYDIFTNQFVLTHPNIKLPPYSKCYSINESYSQKWSPGIKNFIEWVKTPNPEEHRPYTARYVGSLVSDFHRNLLYGGIFIYPTDKLRLLYECAPLARIIEQAGGLGTDGIFNILDINPQHIHHRTSLYIGNTSDVIMASKFLSD